MRRLSKSLELALLGLFIAIVTAQLFVPPLVGLADNGDFAKVLGRVGLSSTGGNFQYFASQYSYSTYRNTILWYSEVVPAWIAVQAHTLVRGRENFDIRYLAAVHAAVFAGIYYFFLLLLWKVHPVPRVILGLLVLWVFTDVFYVAYLSSFYSDTAALLSLFAMVISALHIVCRSRRRWAWWSVYAVAALFFVTSKAQHAIWAIFPAAFALVTNWRSSRLHRGLALGFCLMLVAASSWVLSTLPGPMKAMPLFDVVFLKLTSDPHTSSATLHDLGLPQSYSKYVGTSAWVPDSPIYDGEWRTNFYVRVRHRLPWFYLSHPGSVIEVMDGDLRLSAPYLRPPELANHRREDGYPPYSLATHFSSWSDLRARLFHTWPEHMLLWYGMSTAGAFIVAKKSRSVTMRNAAGLCLGLIAMGIGEFCFASLTDAAQTARHLFLFHAFTDLTVCFAAAAALVWLFPSSQRDKRALIIRASEDLTPGVRLPESSKASQSEWAM